MQGKIALTLVFTASEWFGSMTSNVNDEAGPHSSSDVHSVLFAPTVAFSTHLLTFQ